VTTSTALVLNCVTLIPKTTETEAQSRTNTEVSAEVHLAMLSERWLHRRLGFGLSVSQCQWSALFVC